MTTDPIADMLTRIRNAVLRRSPDLALPYSKLKAEIAKVLVAQGYLTEAEAVTNEEGRRELRLSISYVGRNPVIEGIRRISKPGQRIYESTDRIKKMASRHIGDLVVSTTKGLLTGRETIKAGLGGEVLFRIW